MFGGQAYHELHTAEILRPGSTRAQPPTALPEDTKGMATWMSTTQLQSSLRAEHRQRQDLAEHVLSIEQQLTDAREECQRGATALLNERARADAAEQRATQLAHEKKHLQREATRLKEQLERLTAQRRSERDSACEACDRALATTVARFRQQQRVWVRERQRMASAAQEMGTHMVDKEAQLERAAKQVDKMQHEMETAVVAAQHELEERDTVRVRVCACAFARARVFVHRTFCSSCRFFMRRY